MSELQNKLMRIGYEVDEKIKQIGAESIKNNEAYIFQTFMYLLSKSMLEKAFIGLSEEKIDHLMREMKRDLIKNLKEFDNFFNNIQGKNYVEPNVMTMQ